MTFVNRNLTPLTPEQRETIWEMADVHEKVFINIDRIIVGTFIIVNIAALYAAVMGW